MRTDDALADFLDDLRARRRSDRTRDLYRQAVTRLDLGNLDVTDITKRHIVDHLNTLHDTPGINSATVALHYRHLRGFFNWLAAEEEIDTSPMAKIKQPSVTDRPPDVLTSQQIETLIATCKGRDFDARRDTAIIMILADTGIRLGELHGLELPDWNRDHRVLTVTGKGDKTRTAPLGDRSSDALARYVRARRGHRGANLDALWLGRAGRLGTSGIAQLLNRRGVAAGLGKIHPHQFRHGFAHEFLAAGGQESDLMMLGGWASSEMVRRYGRSVAVDRAIAAHRRLSPLDNH